MVIYQTLNDKNNFEGNVGEKYFVMEISFLSGIKFPYIHIFSCKFPRFLTTSKSLLKESHALPNLT